MPIESKRIPDMNNGIEYSIVLASKSQREVCALFTAAGMAEGNTWIDWSCEVTAMAKLFNAMAYDSDWDQDANWFGPNADQVLIHFMETLNEPANRTRVNRAFAKLYDGYIALDLGRELPPSYHRSQHPTVFRIVFTEA